MIKYTLSVDGMSCSMCEAHVNDVIRSTFQVKKVSSSHAKNQTSIITEEPIDEKALKEAIEKTGYKVLSVSCEAYEKKGLFGFKK